MRGAVSAVVPPSSPAAGASPVAALEARLAAAEEEYAALVSLATEKRSGSALARRIRDSMRDPACRSPRVFDAGFHAGWTALQGLIAGALGNQVKGPINRLREKVQAQRAEAAAFHARASRHKQERRELSAERSAAEAALAEMSRAAADYLYVGEDEAEWKAARARLVRAVAAQNDREQANKQADLKGGER